MNITNKRLKLIFLFIGLLLLVPLIAMQFTNEVNWTGVDFVAAAILLGSAGLGFEFVLRSVKSGKYRFILSVAILIILLLTWAELSVGIFGTPFGGH